MSTPLTHGPHSPSTPSMSFLGGARQRETLLSAFVLCRTTLEDLSRRTGAYGDALAVSVLANYLTGRCNLPATSHNLVAGAINLRLQELSRPPTAAYRWPGDGRG